MYGEKLEMANYLLPNNILKLEEQREIFEIHVRTNSIPSNWGKQTLCETGCSKLLNNEHILKCEILNVKSTTDINYIHNGSIAEFFYNSTTIKRNMRRRNMYLPQDSDNVLIS